MNRLLALPSRPASLRLLVLAVSDRCDQRCAHCQIWMGPEAGREPNLTLEQRVAVVEEALAMGIEECLLTGGEPLLSADLWPIAERLQRGGVRSLLATNGLLLATYAREVAALFAEVYVSLDGAHAETHDALRGVPSFDRVAAGAAAIRAITPRPLLVARATLHRRNLGEFGELVESARRIGFDHVSFLPIDVSSPAFGGRVEARQPLAPTAEQIDGFGAAVQALDRRGGFADGFILESPRKLDRLADHLRASAGLGSFGAPECDAPWWSSVVEADGAVKPCFFHASVGQAGDGLRRTRESEAQRRALAEVRRGKATCDACVCPKRRGLSMRERLFA